MTEVMDTHDRDTLRDPRMQALKNCIDTRQRGFCVPAFGTREKVSVSSHKLQDTDHELRALATLAPGPIKMDTDLCGLK